MSKVKIGIDCGVKTGISVWYSDTKTFAMIRTVKIHQALAIVQQYMNTSRDLEVIVEDARQVRFFKHSKESVAKAQGAGSVKRDAKIWEDFLTDYGVKFQMKRPSKALTKIDSDTFKKLTGWQDRTSEHARDSAMLVYQL